MEFLIPPWQHQLETIEKAKSTEHWGLIWEPGTGKTGTTVNILRTKFNTHKRILRTLILCPLIVVRNWKDEFAKHSKLDPNLIVPLDSAGPKRLALFKENAWNPDGSPRGAIFVTNYEAIVVMKNLYEELLKWAPEVLVADESHKLKDIQSKRTKQAIKIVDGEVLRGGGGFKRPPVRYRYVLTGTPVLNSPMDLFSQYRVLDGGKTFGKNFYIFRSEYFYDKNAAFKGRNAYFPDWQIKAGALEKINAKIYQYASRVLKYQCLDLPPLVKQVIKVGMTPEQTKAYSEMKKDFLTFIGEKAVVAELAITKALRLLQISSGYVKFEDGDTKSFASTPKMEALREYLEVLTPTNKVLVWAVFKENYAQIRRVCEELKIKYVEVHGEIPNKEKFEAVDRFNNDISVRVFIGHPGSGGIGINLIAASYSIFYSRTFSLEQDIQAEARNYRGGSEIHEKVTRIDLVTQDTIDELVVQALASKQTISEELLKEWKTKI